MIGHSKQLISTLVIKKSLINLDLNSAKFKYGKKKNNKIKYLKKN